MRMHPEGRSHHRDVTRNRGDGADLAAEDERPFGLFDQCLHLGVRLAHNINAIHGKHTGLSFHEFDAARRACEGRVVFSAARQHHAVHLGIAFVENDLFGVEGESENARTEGGFEEEEAGVGDDWAVAVQNAS